MFIQYFDHLQHLFNHAGSLKDDAAAADLKLFQEGREAYGLFLEIQKYITLLRNLFKFLFIVRQEDQELVFNYLNLKTYEEYRDHFYGLILDVDALVYIHRQFPKAFARVHESLYHIITNPAFLLFERISRIPPQLYFSTLGAVDDSLLDCRDSFDEMKQHIRDIYEHCLALTIRHKRSGRLEYDGDSDFEEADLGADLDEDVFADEELEEVEEQKIPAV